MNISNSIFELRNEEINVKKILAVINATYAVAKRKPEKNQACRNYHRLLIVVTPPSGRGLVIPVFFLPRRQDGV